MSLAYLLPEEERGLTYDPLEQLEDMLNYEPPLAGETIEQYVGRLRRRRAQAGRGVHAQQPRVLQQNQTINQIALSDPFPNNARDVQVGSWSFRWAVERIVREGLPFAPIAIGGGDVLDEDLQNLAGAQILGAITGKNITGAGKSASSGAPYVVEANNATVSLLYNMDDPLYSILLTLLRSRIAILRKMRIQVTDNAFQPYLQALRLYLIDVGPFRRFDSNALALSQKFSAQQFQSGIIEFEFDKPIALTPNRFICLDISINSLSDIKGGSNTTMFNIHFEEVQVYNPFRL